MIVPYKSGSVRLTSPFGWRDDPFTGARAYHGGVDLVGQSDKRIAAVRAGKVAFAGKVNDEADGGRTWQWGNYVRVDTADGLYKDYYCHMSTLSVRAGDDVEAGDILGVEGASGRATGSHLHFEVRRLQSAKVQLDPTQFLGILNAAGTYGPADDAAIEKYAAAVVEKCGFEPQTKQYLSAYKYAGDLWRKLYGAIFGGE